MKKVFRVLALAGLVVLGTGALSGQIFPRPKKENQLRTLEGLIMGKGDAPLPGAVVYLKNVKTLAVKSLYSGDDGSYRFNALSPNSDYEVFAEYKGQKSSVKTLSSFDSRPAARINLHIDIEK
ncbi:MAG: carboxypeptidase-like regulatory domain-containing protein [Acidobacteriota bacterium]|nr:carboxypeptidase-like regulatory domain-containing protein [Acidobacteriota bacterium]